MEQVRSAVPEQTGLPVWSSPFVHLAVIVSAALVMFLFQLGRADWEDDSESCGGQIVQEMVSGNGWILPLRNDRHIPVKPPLFYWLGALSATLRHSGGDRLDARLPSALMAIVCLIAVYTWTRRVVGWEVALFAALLLLTTPQFLIEARNSRVDATFATFLTVGLLLAQRVWEGEAGQGCAVVAGLCFGLATLSKGPLALALVVLALGAAVIAAPPFPSWRLLLSPATVLAAVGVPALWYAAATVEHGWAFVHLHVYSENVSRLLGEQGHYPLWWYLEPLVTGGLPWTVALPAVLWGDSALPRRSRRFLWMWVVAMLVFLSFSPGKRRAYLLVLRPALAIVLAGWLVPQLARWRGAARSEAPSRVVNLAILALTVFALVGLAALYMGIGGFGSTDIKWSYWWRQYLHDHLASAVVFMLGIGGGGALIVRWSWQRRLDLATLALAATVALGLTIGVAAGAIVRGAGASFGEFARQVSSQIGPSVPLAFFNLDDDSAIAFLFDVRRHVPVVEPVSADRPCDPPEPGFYLVSELAWEQQTCFHDAPWVALARGGPTVASQRWRRLVLARYGSPVD